MIAKRCFCSIRLISLVPGGIFHLLFSPPRASAQTGPIITRQPVSQTAVLGSKVTLDVAKPFAVADLLATVENALRATESSNEKIKPLPD